MTEPHIDRQGRGVIARMALVLVAAYMGLGQGGCVTTDQWSAPTAQTKDKAEELVTVMDPTTPLGHRTITRAEMDSETEAKNKEIIERRAKVADFQALIRREVNRMTYDEALMKWGEPSSRMDGDNVFIVTWKGAWQSKPCACSLRLSFDKETRKLQSLQGPAMCEFHYIYGPFVFEW